MPLYDTCMVSVVTSGISSSYIENRESEIVISPNPVRDKLMIRYRADAVIRRVVVYTLDGREVMNVRYDNNMGVNVTELRSGMYIINAYMDDGGTAYRSFYKE